MTLTDCIKRGNGKNMVVGNLVSNIIKLMNQLVSVDYSSHIGRLIVVQTFSPWRVTSSKVTSFSIIPAMEGNKLKGIIIFYNIFLDVYLVEKDRNYQCFQEHIVVLCFFLVQALHCTKTKSLLVQYTILARISNTTVKAFLPEIWGLYRKFQKILNFLKFS